jgi:hypothetical protein
MTITGRNGREVPFFPTNYTYEDIRTANFDPITTLHDGVNVTPTHMNASRLGCYQKGGFLVRPDSDGVIYLITLEDYQKNNNSLTGLIPRAFLGAANAWIEIPCVKVYAKNDGTYPATGSYINVALV